MAPTIVRRTQDSDGIILSLHDYWRTNDPFCSERVTSGEENPQNCPFHFGFCHPAGGGPSDRHRQHLQKKLVKIAGVLSEICSRTDRQTDRHTDVLITIFGTTPVGEVMTTMMRMMMRMNLV